MHHRLSAALRLAPSIALAAALIHIASAQTVPTTLRPASVCPDRVILTWSGDPSRSQAVTWRTDTTVTTPRVQYSRSGAGPKPEDGAVEVMAVTHAVKTDTGTVKYHSADMTGLDPATLYTYRVGDGERWSEWNNFRTAAADPKPFSFLYLGDEQNNLLNSCARVMRQAFRQYPDVRFVVHGGDLTNRANADVEWQEWHDMGGWINSTVPSVPTPGNHQYARPDGEPDSPSVLTYFWRPQFALPEHGPRGLEESTYYIDYQGVRVISLNSCEKQREQVAWLTRVLQDNPNRWTVVTFHHPIYSGAKGRDNKELREAWEPVLERFAVDLVLQGHDHVYTRSRPRPGRRSPVPVYVVSVCGQKMYNLGPDVSAARVAEDTQLFQIVSVEGDRLRLSAYTAVGELYDRFELRKRPDGKVTLSDMRPRGVAERRRPAQATSSE